MHVFIVTSGHFLSCDKDGGHTIRSVIAKNPMVHANLMALSFIELELCAIIVLHCGNTRLSTFLLCGLDVDPILFIYVLDR